MIYAFCRLKGDETTFETWARLTMGQCTSPVRSKLPIRFCDGYLDDYIFLYTISIFILSMQHFCDRFDVLQNAILHIHFQIEFIIKLCINQK